MATIVNNYLLPSPNSIPTIKLTPKNTSPFPIHLSGSIPSFTSKQNFQLSAVGSISYPQTDLDYWKSDFEAQGVTFSSIGDGYVVKMKLENGTTAKMMLPNGLITSFRALMWHGGTVELLHTSVTQSENDGGVVIQGGLSLVLSLESDGGVSWSPNDWSFVQVKGNPQESIQVELISRNTEAKTEVKHIITLHQDHLTSEILISNSNTSLIRLTGSVISHLTVSTPDATYAVGLEGSDYFIRPPLVGDYSIIPPDSKKKTDQNSKNFWELNKLFSKSNATHKSADYDEESSVEDLEGEEDDNYKHLTEKLSRIYTSAPRNITIIDRGRRNSVTVRREGFNELYMFSPGSEHEWYSKYSYICVGHSAELEPIILNPQSEWRGGLQLWNPNT